MPTKELIDAAILELRAKALEQYSVLKGTLSRPPQEGDAMTLAAGAVKLAQFEGGLITLQQYSASLLEPVRTPPTPEPVPITPENSESMKRTLEAHSTRQYEEDEEETDEP